jgi:transposase
MPALVIRDDVGSEELRRQARREHDGRVSARLIALANALDGMDRASAARLAGMDRQTLRDWVHRYNAEGIAGLYDRPKPGRTPKLTEGQMASLKAIVLAGPNPVVDQIGRWRIVDLCRYVEERWDVSYSETGMLRLLWSLDLSHRKTRPRHPQSDEKAQQAFKKGLCCLPNRDCRGPSRGSVGDLEPGRGPGRAEGAHRLCLVAARPHPARAA